MLFAINLSKRIHRARIVYIDVERYFEQRDCCHSYYL